VWTPPTPLDTDFVGYRVYYSSSLTSGYQLAGTTTLTGFVVSSLATGIPYDFVVRSVDAAPQESANSNVASGTPGTIVNPNPPPPPTCPLTPPDCTEASGPPNGTPSNVDPGEVLILDLGPGNGILNGPNWDFVYYEVEAIPPPSYRIIQMDWVTVELSLDATIWHVVFAWSTGNEPLAQSANIAPYAIAGGMSAGYCDLVQDAIANELIPMLPFGEGSCPAWVSGLYGTLPYQTGIAIDIGGIPPPSGEGYRYIRIQTRPDAAQPAEIDGIERLN
jgi:hypothetical protein